ncbi:hypothetical protein LCGC14_0220170 [marine sediment metagenome]|uniref:Uncharacterized protein n=1 Tax=marine sediment metagenome TaxID=412755 RepID=A0A0F9UUH5_9ZZZZ
MFGQAKLEIPTSGNIGPSCTTGLSDQLAMTIGRTAARTLSEQDGYVVVTLESGSVRVIGYNTIHDKLVIGRLTI